MYSNINKSSDEQPSTKRIRNMFKGNEVSQFWEIDFNWTVSFGESEIAHQYQFSHILVFLLSVYFRLLLFVLVFQEIFCIITCLFYFS